MTQIFLLLILFQFKHFLADFPLQTEYMLGKFRGTNWALPLMAHAGVHAAITLLICLAFGSPWAPLCSAIDFIIHGSMDRIKASPHMLGRFKPLGSDQFSWYASTAKLGDANSKRAILGNKLFWWSLGLDQMVHHLTHYFIIWRILS